MNREEAIKYCDEYLARHISDIDKEFLKIAKEALQQEPCSNCCNGNQIEKAKLCQKSYLAGMEHKQEACEDAISRQAVNRLQKYRYNCGVASITCVSLNSINTLPPVTPQQKMGKWVKTPKAVMGDGYMWYCDKCEHQVYQDTSRDYPSEKYCPNCGCAMKGE